MTLQEIRKFLDACHEVSHIIAAFPELPKGLSPRHMKALLAIHDLQTSQGPQINQDLPIGANPPGKTEECSPSGNAAADNPSDGSAAGSLSGSASAGNPAGDSVAADSADESASYGLCESDHRVKISDVSAFLGGTRPSVTKLVRELEAHGALTKTPDTADKRIIWLHLTPLGEQYYDFYCLRYHTWLGHVLGEIPQEDFETTIRTIYNVQNILRENQPPKSSEL